MNRERVTSRNGNGLPTPRDRNDPAASSIPRVLIIDNFDSFVYNLYQLIGELTGTIPTVIRNDTNPDHIAAHMPTHVIFSPGPGNPEDSESFGICNHVIDAVDDDVPVLGVCLGHQGIAAKYGARIVRAPQAVHGRTSPVWHVGTDIFAGLQNPMPAMRYHSLAVDPVSVPACLVVTAWTDDGIIMGISHTRRPVFGVQFHPESIGTVAGLALLANFVSMNPSTPCVAPARTGDSPGNAGHAGHQKPASRAE